MAQQFTAIDKTFVITGGASGLGAEYAQVFLSKGAKGIAILDIAEDAGKLTATRLNKLFNDKVVFIKCDVSKEEDITGAFDAILTRFKQIDVIINNAGIMSDAPSIWRTACDVNWQGLVSFTLKGVKHMRNDEGGAGGTIINISSAMGLVQFPFLPIYSGSKLAVLHFSQSLAMDPFFENTNIRILTMCFGATDTPLLQNMVTRCYDPNSGAVLANLFAEAEYQRVESAVTAFIDMFEQGAPGTVWQSVDNKPALDITPVINRVFKQLSDVVYTNEL